jgi:hypothetical protein
MSALAAARATLQKGVGIVIFNNLDAPQKGNTKIYNGSIVVSQAGYAKAGVTGTGLTTLGIANLAPVVGASDATANGPNGQLADGIATIRVAQGVFLLANSTAGDAITQADVYSVCYVVDDQTVAKTDGSGTRSIAGVIMEVVPAGVYVSMGPQIGPIPTSFTSNVTQLQTQVGQGNPEEISASGAVSIVKRTTRFTVSGTKAWTLADGTTAGQRKTLFCVSQASTPVGVVTPAHASGFTTITFGASSANASVELEFDTSLGTPAWKVVGVSGTVTIA